MASLIGYYSLIFGFCFSLLIILYSVKNFRNSTIFIEKDQDSYNNPILYTDNPLLSGYISEENLEILKSTTPLKIQKNGKGTVIYLTDNTNFRAFWYGTNKVLMNAIFFGKIM